MVSREELFNLRHNPGAMQNLILSKLENYNDVSLSIEDASNPFNLLLEAAVTLSANSLLEVESIMRKKYPSLAVTLEDIYHHIPDNWLHKLFSEPSETNIIFFVNILDLKMNGYRPKGERFMETTIPENTAVEILNHTFTLLNDIIVRVYDNDSIFVEQQLNSNPMSNNSIGILPSAIHTTKTENTSWITFQVPLKQLKKRTIAHQIVASNGVNINYELEDRYHTSNIKCKMGNNFIEVYKTYSLEYIEPHRPTCSIKFLDNNIINFSIPDINFIKNSLRGNLIIDIYETKGNVYLPINKYETSEFKISLGDTGKNLSSATSKNIAIACNSQSILEGGKNSINIDEIKDRVINNDFYNKDYPITEKHLSFYAKDRGFDIIKVSDTITNRLYVASKELPTYKSSLIKSKIDLFFNNISFTNKDIEDHYNFLIKKDSIIIKSGTLFGSKNNTFFILNSADKMAIDSRSGLDLIQYVNSNNIYYNPYYYLIENKEVGDFTHVYDLDRPSIKFNRIVAKNINVPQKVNIDRRGISKLPFGYRVYLTLLTNSEFDSITKSNIKVIGRLEVNNSNDYVFIYGNYNPVKDMWAIDIRTSHFLTSQSTLDVVNGISSVETKFFNLSSILDIYILATDSDINDESKYLYDELSYLEELSNKTIFTKEELTIEFGSKFDNIWNRVYNSFDEEKYKTYKENIPLLYTEDVYEVFPETSSYFKCEDGGVSFNILHKKGEPILDEDNNPVFKHRKGDIVLGPSGLPELDTEVSLKRYMDIAMIDYKFKLANSDPYINYLDLCLATISKYILEDIKEINSILMDNTSALFKTRKSIKSIKSKSGGLSTHHDFFISPKIVLYLKSDKSLDDKKSDMVAEVGLIIEKYINKEIINFFDVKEEIKSSLDYNILSVSISNIGNDEEIFVYDSTDRFSIGKKIEYDKNHKLIVADDIGLDIVYL